MSRGLHARLQRWGRAPGVEPVVASALRARVVREPLRWLARDALHRGTGSYSSSHVGQAGGPGRLVVACRDVLATEARRCDLLKVDIEGGEWELLRDPRLADCSARLVVVEPNGTADAPADVVAGCRSLLERASYATSVVATATAVTVWGWRSQP